MTTSIQASKEKRSIALTSVLAAIFLTSFKLVIGLITGSLGILSEALHSALDLFQRTVPKENSPEIAWCGVAAVD